MVKYETFKTTEKFPAKNWKITPIITNICYVGDKDKCQGACQCKTELGHPSVWRFNEQYCTIVGFAGLHVEF